MANVKKLYFPHEHYARNDPKLQELLMAYGLAGIGAYWCIVEMLYEQGGYIPLKSLKGISFTLHFDYDEVNNIVRHFDLFACDDEKFWSDAVNRHIEEINKISEKRRKAINKRWEGQRKNNTDVIQEKYKCNTDVIQEKYNKNKNKNKNIADVNINNNSVAVAVADLIEELKSDETWKEMMMMRHHLAADELTSYIDKFALDLQCRGTEAEHTKLSDIKNHINNWIRIQKENERKQAEQRTKANRRGYADVTARTAADYYEDF